MQRIVLNKTGFDFGILKEKTGRYPNEGLKNDSERGISVKLIVK